MTASGDPAGVDGFAGPDPAERNAFNRLFYRNRRPTWVGHWVSQFFCWWARLGLPPQSWVALRVRDRVSGRMRQDAVVIPTVAGDRGTWSRCSARSQIGCSNLEAANGDAVISHGGSVRVRLREDSARRTWRSILREYTCASHRAGENIFRYPSEHRCPSLPRLRRSTRCIESSHVACHE